MKAPAETKIVVAMSGGVDSSVSAALLKEAGFDVVGVFMKCWSQEDFAQGHCTAEEDEYWARRAAQSLGIPYYSVDFVAEYKQRVVDYFVSEYAAGRTPNPDVMCNNQIKFGVFFDKAINEFGADYIATGHYARVQREGDSVRLLKGVDENKDQSYFLYRVGREQLAKTMFPIGGYTKDHVRDMARAYKLPNAEKRDSQGICFIGQVDVREFLRQYIPTKEGAIVTTNGKVIGSHEGVQFYTIGQRKGMGVGGGIPYYVVEKQMVTNTLVVGTEYDKRLARSMFAIEDVHWINEAPRMGKTYTASIRYRQKPQAVTLRPVRQAHGRQAQGEPGRFELHFTEPQRAVTDGQSVVVYNGDEVIGGGVITA